MNLTSKLTPPFMRETAIKKIRAAEDAWNSRDPERVSLAYEYRNSQGRWFRAYGNENWEFDQEGLMRIRHASINDLPIEEADRKFHWDAQSRPVDYPGLTELGL